MPWGESRHHPFAFEAAARASAESDQLGFGVATEALRGLRSDVEMRVQEDGSGEDLAFHRDARGGLGPGVHRLHRRE